MEDESHKARQLSDMKGQVVFDRVSFGYTPERTIIHDFSATAPLQVKRLRLLARLGLVRQLLSIFDEVL